MARCAAFSRGIIAIVLVASWNIATTHCAFAAAVTATPPGPVQKQAADECPMHAAKKPAPPQKKNGCADQPCCKTLPATPATKVIAVAKATLIAGQLDYASNNPNQLELDFVAKQIATLDTGPPRPNKFIKVILQRSIPAHAPPRLP